MTSSRFRRFVTRFVLVVAGLAGSSGLAAQNAQQNAADAERLIKALDVGPGSVVAEVGAGDGALTVAIAASVNPVRMFSNEVNPDRLAAIRVALQQAGVKNVDVVAGGPTATGFPDDCCDAIFMRDVYHHFTNPAAMNASLLKSLKPGGRLAILDFGPPPGGESEDPAGRAADGHHGITPPTLEREIRAAGFEIVSKTEYGFRSVLLVARRPRGELLTTCCP